MTTKLKIDLSQGLLEVEGSESFVRTIYSDFKTHFAGIEEALDEKKRTRRSRKTKTTSSTKGTIPVKKSSQQPAPAQSKQEKTGPDQDKPSVSTPTYTYIEELELKAKDGRPSLVEFMDSKFPITNEERNIVFLYYLQHMLDLKPITPDHLYTCYREAKIRAPLNIHNSPARRGWIEVADDGAMTLTTAGKSYVEDQLPKKVKN